jgi:hypothetical protein
MCLEKHSKAHCKAYDILKMAVFWVVAPYSVVEVYQHFRGTCCLNHQGNEWAACEESVWDIAISHSMQNLDQSSEE